MESEHTDNHGKGVIEYPQHPKTSSTFEALIRSAEMKRNLELMSHVVEAQAAMSGPHRKRQRTKKPPPQVNPKP